MRPAEKEKKKLSKCKAGTYHRQSAPRACALTQHGWFLFASRCFLFLVLKALRFGCQKAKRGVLAATAPGVTPAHHKGAQPTPGWRAGPGRQAPSPRCRGCSLGRPIPQQPIGNLGNGAALLAGTAVEEDWIIFLRGTSFPEMESNTYVAGHLQKTLRPVREGSKHFYLKNSPGEKALWPALLRWRRRQPIPTVPLRVYCLHQSSLCLPHLSGGLAGHVARDEAGLLVAGARSGRRVLLRGVWEFCRWESAGGPRGSERAHRGSFAGAALGMGFGSDPDVYAGPALIYPRVLHVQPRWCHCAHLHFQDPTQSVTCSPYRDWSCLSYFI